MRGLYTLTILLFLPAAAWSYSPRQNGPVPYRGSSQKSEPAGLLDSVYSDLYSDMSTLVRALVTPRATPVKPRGSPRINNEDSEYTGTTAYMQTQDQPIQTKSEYISFLKNSNVGDKSNCADRYNKYVAFFGHDSTLSGQITPKDGGLSNGRLDTTCEFLGYAHWCFALGFAYAIRDMDDVARVNNDNKCMTYQEFCQSGKVPEDFRIEEYLSRVIDEIMFYNTSIKNTNRNIVNTTVRTDDGMTNGWKGYDTDNWIQERLPTSEMKRLLCK